MAKIIWSDEALADLEGVFQYLSLGSLVYAERYVAAAYDRVQILSQHPKIGKAVDEWQDQNFREIQYFPTESFMKFAVGQSFYTHLSIVDARFRKHHHKK